MEKKAKDLSATIGLAALNSKLIDSTADLIRKLLGAEGITLSVRKGKLEQNVGTELTKTFSLDQEQGQNLIYLDGLNYAQLSFGKQQQLNYIIANFQMQYGNLQALQQAEQQLAEYHKEINALQTELELAYSDLNLAHEELSEAYTLGHLLNRNLSRTRLEVKTFLEQAPIAFGILRHRRLKIEIANAFILRLWGKDKSVIGKPLAEALPELKGQPYLGILDEVYLSGERYVGREAPVRLDMHGKTETVYFNFIYEPLKNEKGITNAIMIIATDVTELVQGRLKSAEDKQGETD